MRKLRGFTLIELLIVVAIIAILAAIAVPNFLEAQIRSKVARAQSDMRSMATALESYYVDNNTYPAFAQFGMAGITADEVADIIALGTAPSGNPPGRTFRLRSSTNALSTLTTPIAYITSYFGDPFADTRGLPIRYYAERAGWIMGSFGPDTDQSTGGDLGWAGNPISAGTPAFNDDNGVETVYNIGVAQPSPFLLTGSFGGTAGAFTYDPTNGTVSQGDVWRVKQ